MRLASDDVSAGAELQQCITANWPYHCKTHTSFAKAMTGVMASDHQYCHCHCHVTQMTAESVAELLQSDGHSAAAYHGGMDAGLRAKTQVTH